MSVLDSRPLTPSSNRISSITREVPRRATVIFTPISTRSPRGTWFGQGGYIRFGICVYMLVCVGGCVLEGKVFRK